MGRGSCCIVEVIGIRECKLYVKIHQLGGLRSVHLAACVLYQNKHQETKPSKLGVKKKKRNKQKVTVIV